VAPRAADAAAPSWASGPNALGISVEMAAGAPVPLSDGFGAAMPPFWTWRVVKDGALGAAEAVELPAKGSMPALITSAATAANFLRLTDIRAP
jgi:hypothetical protein